jgi:mRNA interferase RelE/StbE
VAHRIVMTAAARRGMLALPKDVVRRIDACILALVQKPRPPRSVKLKGETDLWRVRVGDYRILYQIEDDRLLVIVIRVAHRREVYR